MYGNLVAESDSNPVIALPAGTPNDAKLSRRLTSSFSGQSFLFDAHAQGNLPSIDLANSCDGDYFPGTRLRDCSSLASDIKACQLAGKTVTISLGGESGHIRFQDDSQAAAYAETIWNLFLGGKSKTRPFGSAILDGIDMDIENGQEEVKFVSLPLYYITAAPQCPYPDAYIGKTLNAVKFDAVYVQFYNNDCGLQHYKNPAWNFATWDNWAKKVSPNRDVKVYIGAPAASYAGSGYVDSKTITSIIQETRSRYSSFGGVMLWDVSAAYANDRYDKAVKQALNGDTLEVAIQAQKPF
ncbi:glycoside hydrolase superfamily [Suillus paluster]|uniref:glycoside hydrolase superfamily n=1 Tax=Suillus paluster TaxID=48578 RepID=UPI001B883896|nr:glycoside hydrolase superfamily [Suillus paluster]KAG1724105.1 glycoside hydrolase superfamily [Suillus paluster]